MLIEAFKTEDGLRFPAAAYAYVPDGDKPSGWKLRLWENPQKKVTKAQLGRAAAALGPRGFRGRKVQIPAAARGAVKAKIRAAYRRLGVKPDDMPRAVREVHLSFDDIRQRLNGLLLKKFGKGKDGYQSHRVENVFQSHFIARGPEGKLFRMSYAFDRKGKITLGNPKEVVVSYVPLDTSVTERHICASVAPLTEGVYDEGKAVLPVTIITPGFNLSKKRFYPAEMLKRDFKIFEGMKMFVDHSTIAQDRARPEGSVRDWGGNLSKVHTEKDGTIRGEAAIIDEQLKLKLANLRKHGQLHTMGLSIRAIGKAKDVEIEGQRTMKVEQLLKGRSVDFVTYAGAGGQVEATESRESDEGDIDLLTLAQLHERRPDLVELIESNGGNTMNEVEQLQEQLAEKEAEIQRLTEAADTEEIEKVKTELKGVQDNLKKAEEKVAESEKATKIAKAKEHLDGLLKESKLPDVAKDKLRKQFKDSEGTDGMKEAIEDEVKYLAKVAPGKVRDLGESKGSGDYEPDMKKRTERFQKMGLSETEAKVAAEGRR
jgi:hypothetical protein